MQCCVNLPMYEEKLKASIQLAKDYAVSHGTWVPSIKLMGSIMA